MSDDIEDFARSRRRATAVRMGIMGLVIASPFLWLGWRCHEQHAKRDAWEAEYKDQQRLSPAEKAELDKLLPELRVSIQRAQKAFDEDVTPEKLETVQPGDQPCVRYHSDAADLDAKLGTKYAALAGNYVEKFKVGEPIKVKALADAARSLESVLEEIKREDEPTKSHLARLRELAKDVDQVVFFVGETSTPVVMVDEYIPGTVRGTAFLYSPAQRKIVCAAHVDVQNAAEVKISYRTSQYDTSGQTAKREAAQSELTIDLGVRTDRAITQGMRAVR